MGVRQDASQGAEDPQCLSLRRAEINSCTLESARRGNSSTHLVEGQRVVEEHVPSNQSDAKLKMTKHVIAVGESQGSSNTRSFQEQLGLLKKLKKQPQG